MAGSDHKAGPRIHDQQGLAAFGNVYLTSPMSLNWLVRGQLPPNSGTGGVFTGIRYTVSHQLPSMLVYYTSKMAENA